LEELRTWLERGDVDAIRRLADEVHPHDIAELANSLDDEQVWTLLREIPSPAAGEVFSHLNLERQARLAERFDTREVATLLEQVAADDRTDLIQELEPEQQQAILAEMAEPERRETERLSTYPEGTVGSVMSTEVATVRVDLSVGQAIEQLRQQAEQKETVFYNYVVDDTHRLVGIVSLKDLLLSRPETPLREVMGTDLVTVDAEGDREDAARVIQQYDLIALPVVHGDHRLVGIVTVDDLIDVQQQEVTEDFHRMAPINLVGMSLKDATLWTLYRIRIPWLMVLVFINIFSGAGIAYFEDTIEAVVALVFFLPLLIDSGGNAGSQSATLMIRSLAVGDVQLRDWMRLFTREIGVALMIGLSMGIAVSFIGVFRADGEVAVVVAMSMVCIVLVGSLIGMSLPFLLARFKLDPATASAPLVTSLADVSGVLIYFGIATWYLSERMADANDVARAVGLG
jgi:magnesium transporter